MSESLRTWGLRLLALCIAIALWFNVSFKDRQALTERVVEASVTYNRPLGFVILDPVGNVNVRLRGSKKQVREINPYMVDVQVSLTQSQPGTFSIPLGPEDVLMPEGLEVVSIEPSAIRVELDREVSQRLPVVPRLVGEPAAGAEVEEAEVFPSQVLVSGPRSLLARTEALTTRPINLDGHALTFEQQVAVVAPDPLIQVIQPAEVTVRVPMGQPGAERQDGTARRPPP